MVFTCSTCEKVFLSRGTLAEHDLVHTGEKIVCPVCNQQLSSQRNLRRHDQTLHEPERKAEVRRERRKKENAEREDHIRKLKKRVKKLQLENDQLRLDLVTCMKKMSQ